MSILYFIRPMAVSIRSMAGETGLPLASSQLRNRWASGLTAAAWFHTSATRLVCQTCGLPALSWLHCGWTPSCRFVS